MYFNIAKDQSTKDIYLHPEEFTNAVFELGLRRAPIHLSDAEFFDTDIPSTSKSFSESLKNKAFEYVLIHASLTIPASLSTRTFDPQNFRAVTLRIFHEDGSISFANEPKYNPATANAIDNMNVFYMRSPHIVELITGKRIGFIGETQIMRYGRPEKVKVEILNIQFYSQKN